MKKEKQRPCPACGESRTKQIGEKNNFLMLSCQNCNSLFSSFLPVGEEAEDYDEYYTESNLKVPEFILKITWWKNVLKQRINILIRTALAEKGIRAFIAA